ncbi:transcriptional regulation of mitochondrial recombination-domain-containing protein [Bisporella sp. PMI_857]|nr:transcriptional regulation of mitochondrial recombination-domain-containing protein [Bisporella sp. PMI_857]
MMQARIKNANLFSPAAHEKLLRKAIPGLAPEHGRDIYVFSHMQTNQVIYSLNKAINPTDALAQIPYNGKKTVPRHIRKDLWNPLATISFKPGAGSIGLSAYQKLREFRKEHELSWGDEIRYKADGKTPESKKARGRKLMDQKANTIADIATVLAKIGTVEGAEIGLKGAIKDEEARKSFIEDQVTRIGEKRARQGFSEAEQQQAKDAKRKELEEKFQNEFAEEGFEKVTVRWSNPVDAEFADTWSENVVHDSLQWRKSLGGPSIAENEVSEETSKGGEEKVDRAYEHLTYPVKLSPYLNMKFQRAQEKRMSEAKKALAKAEESLTLADSLVLGLSPAQREEQLKKLNMIQEHAAYVVDDLQRYANIVEKQRLSSDGKLVAFESEAPQHIDLTSQLEKIERVEQSIKNVKRKLARMEQDVNEAEAYEAAPKPTKGQKQAAYIEDQLRRKAAYLEEQGISPEERTKAIAEHQLHLETMIAEQNQYLEPGDLERIPEQPTPPSPDKIAEWRQRLEDKNHDLEGLRECLNNAVRDMRLARSRGKAARTQKQVGEDKHSAEQAPVSTGDGVSNLQAKLEQLQRYRADLESKLAAHDAVPATDSPEYRALVERHERNVQGRIKWLQQGTLSTGQQAEHAAEYRAHLEKKAAEVLAGAEKEWTRVRKGLEAKIERAKQRESRVSMKAAAQ